METIRLNKPDKAFTREVEHESGQDLSRCYQCGNCTAGCPMNPEYDFSVTRIMRLIQAGQKDSVLSSRAVWMCATCETCTQRCPNNIDVAQVMDVCRHMARREGRSVYKIKSFFDSFLSSIAWCGRAHEMGIMTAFMLRTGRLWTDVELAPKVLPKGKMSILPHVVDGRKEVAAILKRFKEGAADEAVVRAKLKAKGIDVDAPQTGAPAAAPAVDPCGPGGAPIGLDYSATGFSDAAPAPADSPKNTTSVSEEVRS